jgi:hypothetical protein
MLLLFGLCLLNIHVLIQDLEYMCVHSSCLFLLIIFDWSAPSQSMLKLSKSLFWKELWPNL